MKKVCLNMFYSIRVGEMVFLKK
ncbi:hypothetical protein Godav_000810 [Gossypium davidsonii]|uniref:Uncharacterized protein n=1 Tax=Gossypium davidsonii TaxID=34287 RepID=A0A7J8T0T4_GOSDV|nr:hypothetical protein [Gossypium davidsonii]